MPIKGFSVASQGDFVIRACAVVSKFGWRHTLTRERLKVVKATWFAAHLFGTRNKRKGKGGFFFSLLLNKV